MTLVCFETSILSLFRRNNVVLAPIWAHLGPFGPIWPHLPVSGIYWSIRAAVWGKSTHYGSVRPPCVVCFTWNHLVSKGFLKWHPFWAHLALFGPIWPYLALFGPICPFTASIGAFGQLFGISLPIMGLCDPPVWSVSPGTTLFRRGS